MRSSEPPQFPRDNLRKGSELGDCGAKSPADIFLFSYVEHCAVLNSMLSCTVKIDAMPVAKTLH